MKRFWRIVGSILSQPRLAARDPLIRTIAVAIVVVALILWGLAS